MTSTRRRVNQQGFTLMELLIALSVFAVMGVMIMGGLRSLARARSNNRLAEQRLAELANALTLLEHDLIQTVNELPLSYNPLESELEFTRTGWRNPGYAKRSSLKKITYVCRAGQLSRQLWPDPADTESAPFTELLLDKVDKCRVRFFNQSWYEGPWPPPKQMKQQPQVHALEFIITLKDMGVFNRIFLLPGG